MDEKWKTVFQTFYKGKKNWMSPEVIGGGTETLEDGRSLHYEFSQGEFMGDTIYGMTFLLEGEFGLVERVDRHSQMHSDATNETQTIALAIMGNYKDDVVQGLNTYKPE